VDVDEDEDEKEDEDKLGTEIGTHNFYEI